MYRKLFKTVQTITNFRNRLADPVGTRRGPPLVRGPQFENRWLTENYVLNANISYTLSCSLMCLASAPPASASKNFLGLVLDLTLSGLGLGLMPSWPR